MPSVGSERTAESGVEVSHKVETEHATALDEKIQYAQYRVVQKEYHPYIVLQQEA